jgi:hypothetical protein
MTLIYVLLVWIGVVVIIVAVHHGMCRVNDESERDLK